MLYPKIQTVFKRDPDNHYKTLLEKQFSLPEFEYLANCDWTFTEKVDGMNMRVIWDGNSITFGGKTDKAQIPSNLALFMQSTFTEEKMLDVFGNTAVTLYGEGAGAGIQKGGGHYGPNQRLILFDVLIDNWWIERDNLLGMAVGLGIEIVPVIGVGTLYDLVELVRKGFQSEWGEFPAEGIVAKPSCGLKARDGSRIITKLKHNDFSIN